MNRDEIVKGLPGIKNSDLEKIIEECNKVIAKRKSLQARRGDLVKVDFSNNNMHQKYSGKWLTIVNRSEGGIKVEIPNQQRRPYELRVSVDNIIDIKKKGD